jgi:uncharacterized protein YjbI with pentapeptide repeats
LWERLSALPAIFPDGHSIDKKISPWFPTGLLHHFLIHLKNEPPPLSKIQAFTSILLIWVLLPILTLPIFWLKYLPQHSWAMTVVHILLILIATGFGIHSYLLARETLRRNNTSISPHSYEISFGLSGVLGFILCVLSYGSFEAVRQHFLMLLETQPGQISTANIPRQFPKFGWYRYFTPQLLAWFAYSPFPNLENAEVSIKPTNWDGKTLENVVGPKLSKRFLRYSNAASAFLVNVDLTDADLERASLVGADLRGSILGSTNLMGAYLMLGKLQGADLTTADLRGAYLLETDLRGAKLLSADAEKTWLNAAKLQGANLKEANFQCARFGTGRMGWMEVGDKLWGSHKGNEVNVIFLRGAEFRGADLQGTRLEGANLAGVSDLTQEQLDKACVSERTVLPFGLRRPKPCGPLQKTFFRQVKQITSYSLWGIASLQEEAVKVAEGLHNFVDSLDAELQKHGEKKSETRKEFEQSQFMKDQLSIYETKFKPNVSLLRTEMISRLMIEEDENTDPLMFNFPNDSIGMRKVADTVKNLAEQLCSAQ